MEEITMMAMRHVKGASFTCVNDTANALPVPDPKKLPGFAYLEEMTIRIAEKTADLTAPVDRRCEELGATRLQDLVNRLAVGNRSR